MTAGTVIVDPVTRIEGHLRIEAETDDDGRISRASSAGTMVRGIELILRGRDPRDAWAFAQRICGVCTLVHGLASVRSVEDALEYAVPPNANLIRNLMLGAQYIHDHVVHFYHLHALDWVDVVSALSADPSATAALATKVSAHANSSPGYFAEVQDKLKRFVASGQLGIFANGYWGHPAYKLPPEANLLALAHYLEALAWQRDVARLHTIFGGKNPHPNLVVGGVPCAISIDVNTAGAPTGRESATAVNSIGLQLVGSIIASMQQFVNEVYLPDLVTIASFYKDWATQGEGLGNFMTYGDFPDQGIWNPDSFLIPRGVILNRNLGEVQPIDLYAADQVQEFVAHSWYDYREGKEAGLHPYWGETTLAYSGPKPPYDKLDVDQSYSWMKSPRWKGKAVEVGPLARILMLYGKNDSAAKGLVDQTLGQLGLPFAGLYSTLGRTLARGMETKIIADRMSAWHQQLLANIKGGDVSTFNAVRWDPAHWPSTARGAGFVEAPRGALGHWIVIGGRKITNYQAVVPSTWNASPRDAAGQSGAYEAALKGHLLADPTKPIEILRTVHSFDPCIACAVHVVDPAGEELIRVKVQ